ncbi:hypothetical protein [Cupriavidus sp. H18C1]
MTQDTSMKSNEARAMRPSTALPDTLVRQDIAETRPHIEPQ